MEGFIGPTIIRRIGAWKNSERKFFALGIGDRQACTAGQRIRRRIQVELRPCGERIGWRESRSRACLDMAKGLTVSGLAAALALAGLRLRPAKRLPASFRFDQRRGARAEAPRYKAATRAKADLGFDRRQRGLRIQARCGQTGTARPPSDAEIRRAPKAAGQPAPQRRSAGAVRADRASR